MKLPGHIQVGPVRYEVRRETLVKKYGDTDETHQVIKLDPDQGPDQLADTLLHEVLHAVWDQTALREEDDELEERVVCALASPLLDTLRRNRTFVPFLLVSRAS